MISRNAIDLFRSLIPAVAALLLVHGIAVVPRCTEPQAVGRSAGAPATIPPLEPQRWDWEGKVSPGLGVRVENLYGDVRARFGGYEGVVEIHSVIQNLHPQDPPLKVLPESGSAGLTIRVVRDSGPSGITSAIALTPGGKREEGSDRVDLVVRIPKGASFTAITRTGAIEAKGLQSDVTAESESGAIVVREVTGLVKTTNRYGNTEVVLEPPPPASEQVLESLTGDLSLTLPASANVTVVAKTSAWFSTDVSLDIVRKQREEPSKTATARVGKGSARLLLKTKRGGIQILQMDDVGQLDVEPSKPNDTPSDSGNK